MSKLYKTELVTETVTKEKKIRIGFRCDVCRKEHKDMAKKYWKVTTQHHDWGNDSCESIETFDVCSKECLHKLLDEYVRNCDGSYTQEFSIEQERNF